MSLSAIHPYKMFFDDVKIFLDWFSFSFEKYIERFPRVGRGQEGLGTIFEIGLKRGAPNPVGRPAECQSISMSSLSPAPKIVRDWPC